MRLPRTIETGWAEAAAALALFACGAWAQSGGVEIYASAPNTIPQMRTRFAEGRYELRTATVVDLIRTAWGVEEENVVGGPEWLDVSRFDVIAVVPASLTPDTLKTMLQQLLKDRFQLAVHMSNKDTPAYAITAGKKPLLRKASGTTTGGCVQQTTNPPVPRGEPQPPVTFVCRNTTMKAFAMALPDMREASGYLFGYPVLDRTGLAGAWDFSLTWSPRNVLLAAASSGEVVTLSDAIDKQLGMKLSPAKIPTPVVVVDKASLPQVSQAPRPRQEFEVADIRPDDPNAPGSLRCGYIDIQPGGRVRINMSLMGLLLETQGDFNTHRIVFGSQSGEPKFLHEPCWQILAKAPAQEDAPAGWSGPAWNGVDIDSMRAMLRSLLEDRFKLVAHTEDQPVSGYALVAAKPKLRKADSSNRPGCKEGAGADATRPNWKDPRLANPMASRLITCRNVTLAQFAPELNRLSSGAGGTVVDATGIAGRFDITINFSPPVLFRNGAGPSGNGDPNGDGAASTPDGAISIFEALEKQLGLKLEARKVMTPVLVIDRVNETPTDN